MPSKSLSSSSNDLVQQHRVISQSWLCSFGLGILGAILISIPAKAAERIYFNYGLIGLSISVSSLENFAQRGIIDQELRFYLRGVSEADREKFRQALLKKTDINHVLLYRFFRTSIGEAILSRLGQFINIKGGINGKYALRGALVTAANDPEGLTLLNFLRKFPTDIQLNTDDILEKAKLVDVIVRITQDMNVAMAKLTAAEAASETPVNFATLPDIRQAGSFEFIEKTLILNDENRKRKLRAIFYQPKTGRTGKTPVVILSHGLGSRPEDFGRLAHHLASYGYFVVSVQHPGSDFQQVQDLINGYTSEIFDVNDFINRPLDITYVLDILEKQNKSEFQDRLNLESVGVFGHSFGGYTALALAGAEIDFENLAKDCGPNLTLPNTSLLLQCRALDLPKKEYNLRDPRVAAIFTLNLVGSSIFGRRGLSQIKIPVYVGAGSLDVATPAVIEQGRSFLWLTTPNRYLGMIEGQAHVDFSVLDAGITQTINSVTNLTLPNPNLLDQYTHAMSLAFFEIYIAKNAQFGPYLQSSYAEYISEKPFNLYLINANSANQLAQILEEAGNKLGVARPQQ
jgi:predicted dienelactone hydrolase